MLETATKVLCDKYKVQFKVKKKFYKIVIRPAMTYGSECWTINKNKEIKIKCTETRIPWQTCDVTRLDRNKNECNVKQKE